MEYIDPQKARQERERQERERQARIKAERERQARIKAERERQARIKAEKERQAKLKAERDHKARIKAEQEAAKKAQKAEQPELKKPVAQKPENKTPKSEKKPDPKVNSAITWSKPGETTPIHTPSTLTHSSISPIHTTITPIAQLPQVDLKPQALLNRNPRTWKNEKADEPKPEPTLKERITAAKIKAIGQQESEQQQKLSTILTDPKSTENQQRTAKVLSARLKASTIQQALPSDQVTLLNLLPNSQPADKQKPLFKQWLDGSKARLGPGEEKGLEQ